LCHGCVPSEFLEKNIEIWEEDEVYKIRELVHAMRVVKDITQQGVALMEEYNKLHTTNEEQKQYLLLLVKQYRQKYPDTKKST
jgi:4-hydroxy-3-methylbut-2-enyl diphosphate reductase IspH